MSTTTETATVTTGGSWPFLLFLAFLGLKLAGAIDWSWWWVTAPLWITALVSACLFTLLYAAAVLRERLDEG